MMAAMSDDTRPETGDAPFQVLGQIERAAPDRLEGWCWDGARPGLRLTAEILLDERPVAAVPAALFRRDLAQAGIGDGRHAFVLHVPEHPEPGAAAHLDRRRLDAAGMIELREPSSGRIVGRLRQHAAEHTEAEDAQLVQLQRLLAPLALAAGRRLPPSPGSRLRAAFAALSDRLEAQADGWPADLAEIDPIACALHALRRTHAKLRLPIVARPAVTLLLHAPTAAAHRQAVASLAPDLAGLSAEILLLDDGADPLTALLPLVIANLALARPGAPAAPAAPAWAAARAPLLAWLDAASVPPHPRLGAMLEAAARRVVVGPHVAAAAADLGLLDLLAPRWLPPDVGAGCLLLAIERKLAEAAGGPDPALAGSAALAALDLALKARMLGRRVEAAPIVPGVAANGVRPAAPPAQRAAAQARALLRRRWGGGPA
jgi:hypothetical protein